MSDINTLVEKYGDQLAIFFSNRLLEIDAEIDAKIKPLVKEKEDLLRALKTLNKKGDSQTSNGEGIGTHDKYDPTTSYIEKVIYLTKRLGFLTLSDLAMKIVEREPKLKIGEVKATLSAVLSMDAKREPPRLIRRLNDKNKWEYMIK